MPLSELHKKKRKKNFFILAAIFLWCLLIFIVSLIRMANAAEIDSSDAFFRQRAIHNHVMGTHRGVWEEQWALKEPGRIRTEEIRAHNRDIHMRFIQRSQEVWHRKKTIMRPFEELIENQADQRRQDYLQNTAGNPDIWWAERAQRLEAKE